MTVEIEATSAEVAEMILHDVINGNDDVCDVEEAREALDFDSIEMTVQEETKMQTNAKIPMTFQIFHREELVRTETLTQDIIKVGKLPSSHLRIEDENVSRMHAVIEVTGPDEIYIIDLGSAAGTVVNGKKVSKCRLQNGDEIVFGGTRVKIRTDYEDPIK